MRIMVLNDGETYTNLEGCKILELDDDLEEILETRWDIEAGIESGVITVLREF